MSDNKIRFEGLDELKAQLRRLPRDLRAQAMPIVLTHVEGAEREIQANYDAHVDSGNLRSHLIREDWRAGPWGVGYVLRNTAKHAWIFEHGTAARHYITKNGKRKAVGAMPPGKAFLPPVIRWRRQMYEAFEAFLRDVGFEVSGRAA